VKKLENAQGETLRGGWGGRLPGKSDIKEPPAKIPQKKWGKTSGKNEGGKL